MEAVFEASTGRHSSVSVSLPEYSAGRRSSSVASSYDDEPPPAVVSRRQSSQMTGMGTSLMARLQFDLKAAEERGEGLGR